MDIDIRKLQQVATVARTGSISRAAEQLHMSQPALSRSISSLEARFGIRIFDRSRSGAVLTTAGRQAVAEAEELIRRAETLEHNMRLYGSGEAGQVAFGMGPLIASLVLPDLGVHCLARWPRLDVNVSAKSATVLVQDLLADHVEMFFCARDQIPESEQLRMETVGEIDLCMLVRAGHPLAGQEVVTQDDLAGFPVLSGAELSTSGAGTTRGSFICDNYHLLRELALASDGVWMASPQVVAEDLEQGRLRRLRVTGDTRPSRTEVCVVYREGRLLSPAASAIVTFVEAFFARLNAVGDG